MKERLINRGRLEMATDYAFIRAYHKYLGSRESVLDNAVRHARRVNALPDAMEYDEEKKRWTRYSEIEELAEAGDETKQEFCKKIREIMR
jgi:hypothetical protein